MPEFYKYPPAGKAHSLVNLANVAFIEIVNLGAQDKFPYGISFTFTTIAAAADGISTSVSTSVSVSISGGGGGHCEKEDRDDKEKTERTQVQTHCLTKVLKWNKKDVRDSEFQKLTDRLAQE